MVFARESHYEQGCQIGTQNNRCVHSSVQQDRFRWNDTSHDSDQRRDDAPADRRASQSTSSAAGLQTENALRGEAMR